MRPACAAVVALLLMLSAACGRGGDVGNNRGPQEQAERKGPRFSYLNLGDVRTRAQLLTGWYPIEEGTFRWMGREADAVLLVTTDRPLNFELKLFFPPDHIKRAGGPVTVTVLLDGREIARQTYSDPGGYTLSTPLPAGAPASSQTNVIIRLDRAVPPSGEEKRELGAAVSSFGLVPKPA